MGIRCLGPARRYLSRITTIFATKMATTANGSNGHQAKNILTISASKSLHGTTIASTIESNWSQLPSMTSSQFNNVGFDFSLEDLPRTLESLKRTLNEQQWDAVILGWCLRGNVERTKVFEQAVGVVIEAARKQEDMKVLFSKGPRDLAGTVLRGFAVGG